MTDSRVVAALMCATLAITPSTHAQSVSAQAEPLVAPDIKPSVFVGPNSPPGTVGSAVRWPLPGHLSLEFESTQRMNIRGANSGGNPRPMTVDLNLVFDLPEVGRVTPYVSGGIGLRQYVIGDRSPTGLFVTQDTTAHSVNAGAGVKVRGDENWSMRTDAGWSRGLGQSTSETWRLFNGITLGRQGP